MEKDWGRLSQKEESRHGETGGERIIEDVDEWWWSSTASSYGRTRTG